MDLRGTDLNLLVAFDALMAERSVTRAGTRIGRTQPAMSAALARLRALFGDELFVRSRDGLQPTPRALDLAGPLSEALAQIESTLAFTQRFEPSRSSAVFHLGLSDHPAFALTSKLMPLLQERAPQATLHVRGFTDRRLAIELLEAGEVDASVGVSAPAGAGIVSMPLFEERFVCIARKGHPDLAKGLDLETFLSLPQLLVSPEGDKYGHVDAKLHEMGRRRRLALTMPQMYAAPHVVANSDLLAVLMEGVVQASGCLDRLEVFTPPLELPMPRFILAWHRRNDVHPAQRWFRDLIASIYPPRANRPEDHDEGSNSRRPKAI